MKNEGFGTQFILTFFIVTACITILSGVLGVLFLPDMRFGYEAFLSPPIFGFLSALSGLVTKSKKELSIKEVIFREALQLLLIEVIVFGINYMFGATFIWELNVTLAIAIVVIFVLVYVILWLNDQRIAMLFNERLLEYQRNQKHKK